ncbi:sigma 54-interacting transcriptional regulator [Terasakiella sp. A23]|uniref:sigma-54 interaction domain-containing protein n=1 Tax=Terasakiella sp. FCG-A23 TaxID=3080561 RepID=UPI0029533D24|nr:sigma 54-interacting transcriptional regulator [Terasakiella sp. A23]MDV7340608.1 sigma 54-interacting transcriptional regulator [Terasakiella sp. A23]
MRYPLITPDHKFEDFIEEFKQRGMQSLFEVFESACMGAVAVDLDGKIIWISDQYRDLLHKHNKNTVIDLGAPIQDLVPNSLLQETARKEKPMLLDLMRLGKEWVIVTRVPLFDEKNVCFGAMGFILMNNQESLKPLLSKVERLQKELTQTRHQLANSSRQAKYTFSSFIGSSRVVRETKLLARKAAQVESPVLLLGETGTGKELLAHSIHSTSLRAGAPFVSINVAAIPENLLESEFFGTAPGAYTGAERKGRDGKLKLVEGGSLFLDEIGDMPLSLQSKLLRVLQEKEFEPVGSNKVIKADFRVIAATSRDLAEMVHNGEFRADLYYRLNVLPINIPPLRQRPGDLALLCAHFLEEAAHTIGDDPFDMSKEALEVCSAYDWPGNVRELQNVMERLTTVATSHVFSAKDIISVLPISQKVAQDATRDVAEVGPLDQLIEETERTAILRALTLCNYNKQQAAKQLQISRGRLYDKMKALNIPVDKT